MSVSIINSNRFERRPTVVLFDLDNTLYSYEPAHNSGMAAVRRKVESKLGIDSSQFTDAYKEARSDVKNRLGSIASSHSRLLYFQRTLENLGLRSQALFSLELEQTYWGNFLGAAELREGVHDFLDQLARANIPKVLVTDLTAQIQFRKLVYLELDQRFEYVVTSEESGADKPNQVGFKIALEKLGVTEPSNEIVWMIGDNVVSDIEGAKNSIDASTLALKEALGEQSNNPAIDLVFDSFQDLEKFISSKGWDQPSKN